MLSFPIFYASLFIAAPIRQYVNILGGCEGTEFGCCPGTIYPCTESNCTYCMSDGHVNIIGGCDGAEFGCCPGTIDPCTESNCTSCSIGEDEEEFDY